MERVFQSIIDPLCPFARNRPFSLRLGALQYFAAHRRSVLFIDDRFGSTLTRSSGKLISFFLAFLDDAPRRHVVAPGPGPCSPPASNYDESSWRLSFFFPIPYLYPVLPYSAPLHVSFSFVFRFFFVFFAPFKVQRPVAALRVAGGRRRFDAAASKEEKNNENETRTRKEHVQIFLKTNTSQARCRATSIDAGDDLGFHRRPIFPAKRKKETQTR